jgi:ATP-dependent helicase/nuclease subunit B
MSPMSPPPPRRWFLDPARPALAGAAEWLVENFSTPDRVDLSGVRVVLPGARPQQRLLEQLLELAEGRGRSLAPPDLSTPGQLPELLVPPRFPEPHPVVGRAAWRAALQAMDAERLSLVFPLLPEAGELAGWDALALRLETLQTEVGAAGHDFQAVARLCGAGGLLHDDAPRWQILAEVQQRSRALLQASGLEDRESARRAALTAPWPPIPPSELPRALVLVGTVELLPVVRHFLEGFPGALHVLIHAAETEAHRFDSLGTLTVTAEGPQPLLIPADRLRIGERPEGQARHLVRFLREEAEGLGPDQITVGLPDESLLPTLRGALDQAGVRTRSATGRPLHRTSPYRLLEALQGFLAGSSFESLAALLRHPTFPSALQELGEEALSVALDAYHALHLPQRLPEGRIPFGAAAGERERSEPRGLVDTGAPSPAILRIREGLHHFLTPLGFHPPQPRPLSQWVGPVRELLQALYPGRMLNRQNPSDRALLTLVEAVGNTLQGLEALPSSLDTSVEGADALALILGMVGETPVPELADPGAVEVVGWLELALEDAPLLALVGVNEPALPASTTADPFLPDALRTRLGLVDNRFRFLRDHHLLSSLLTTHPRRILLVAGRRDGTGTPLRPSRLLLSGPGEAIATRVLQLLKGEEAFPAQEAPGAAPEPLETGSAAASTTPLVFPPEPVISAPNVPDTLSVTGFRGLLVNPYLYALERILHLNTLTDEARELDPMNFGNLAHRVVEGWGRLAGADQMLEERIREALGDLLSTMARETFGANPLPAVRVQVELLRLRLGGLASLQAKRNQEGWEIRGVEASIPEGGKVPFPVDGEPFFLTGRVDRVDYHPHSRQWQLLDLKTSEKAKDPDAAHRKGSDEAKVWTDLQLPLYRHLGPALADAEKRPLGVPDFSSGMVNLGYLQLPADPAGVTVSLASWGEEELLSADEAARAAIRHLRANRFEWVPGVSRVEPWHPLVPVLGLGILEGLDSDLSWEALDDD